MIFLIASIVLSTFVFNSFDRTLLFRDLSDDYVFVFVYMITLLVFFDAIFNMRKCFFVLLSMLGFLRKHIVRLTVSKNNFHWEDQIVLITGGSNGLGKRLARRFIQQSSTVIIFDVDPVNMSDMEVSSPGRLFYYNCNITKRDQIYETSAFITKQIGTPTVLINNAGVQHNSFLLNHSDTLVEDTMNTNIMAPFWIIKAFLPAMIRNKKGHIINVSSCLGLGGVAKLSDYCSSKFAMYGLNESLRQELKLLKLEKYVKTSIICPFMFNSNMFANTHLKWRRILKPLEIDGVVDRVEKVIEDNRSTEVWLPWFTIFLPLLRLFPCYIYDFVQNLSGANESLLTEEERLLIENNEYSRIKITKPKPEDEDVSLSMCNILR